MTVRCARSAFPISVPLLPGAAARVRVAVPAFVEDGDAGQHLLMKHARMASRLLISSAHFFAQCVDSSEGVVMQLVHLATGFLIASPHLVTQCIDSRNGV